MTSLPFWAPLALLGFAPWMILLQLSISLIYQFWMSQTYTSRQTVPVAGAAVEHESESRCARSLSLEPNEARTVLGAADVLLHSRGSDSFAGCALNVLPHRSP